MRLSSMRKCEKRGKKRHLGRIQSIYIHDKRPYRPDIASIFCECNCQRTFVVHPFVSSSCEADN